MTAFALFLHDRLANAMLLFALLAGLWGLVAYLRGRGVSGSYWGVLAAAEVLFIAQGVVGVLVFMNGLRPARGIHWLYGFVAVLTLPAYYAFSQGRDDRRAALAYGLLCLFLFGISLRAMSTGG